MLPDGLIDLLFFGLYNRAVVVASSANVTCFTDVLLRANFATNETDAAVSQTKHVANYVTTHDGAVKTVRVGVVLAQKAFGMASKHVFKPSFGNGSSNLALIIMSFNFLGRLNAAIGGFLKRSAICLLL